jgi:hypothetical protein
VANVGLTSVDVIRSNGAAPPSLLTSAEALSGAAPHSQQNALVLQNLNDISRQNAAQANRPYTGIAPIDATLGFAEGGLHTFYDIYAGTWGAVTRPGETIAGFGNLASTINREGLGTFASNIGQSVRSSLFEGNAQSIGQGWGSVFATAATFGVFSRGMWASRAGSVEAAGVRSASELAGNTFNAERGVSELTNLTGRGVRLETTIAGTAGNADAAAAMAAQRARMFASVEGDAGAAGNFMIVGGQDAGAAGRFVITGGQDAGAASRFVIAGQDAGAATNITRVAPGLDIGAVEVRPPFGTASTVPVRAAEPAFVSFEPPRLNAPELPRVDLPAADPLPTTVTPNRSLVVSRDPLLPPDAVPPVRQQLVIGEPPAGQSFVVRNQPVIIEGGSPITLQENPALRAGGSVDGQLGLLRDGLPNVQTVQEFETSLRAWRANPTSENLGALSRSAEDLRVITRNTAFEQAGAEISQSIRGAENAFGRELSMSFGPGEPALVSGRPFEQPVRLGESPAWQEGSLAADRQFAQIRGELPANTQAVTDFENSLRSFRANGSVENWSALTRDSEGLVAASRGNAVAEQAALDLRQSLRSTELGIAREQQLSLRLTGDGLPAPVLGERAPYNLNLSESPGWQQAQRDLAERLTPLRGQFGPEVQQIERSMATGDLAGLRQNVENLALATRGNAAAEAMAADLRSTLAQAETTIGREQSGLRLLNEPHFRLSESRAWQETSANIDSQFGQVRQGLGDREVVQRFENSMRAWRADTTVENWAALRHDAESLAFAARGTAAERAASDLAQSVRSAETALSREQLAFREALRMVPPFEPVVRLDPPAVTRLSESPFIREGGLVEQNLGRLERELGASASSEVASFDRSLQAFRDARTAESWAALRRDAESLTYAARGNAAAEQAANDLQIALRNAEVNAARSATIGGEAVGVVRADGFGTEGIGTRRVPEPPPASDYNVVRADGAGGSGRLGTYSLNDSPVVALGRPAEQVFGSSDAAATYAVNQQNLDAAIARLHNVNSGELITDYRRAVAEVEQYARVQNQFINDNTVGLSRAERAQLLVRPDEIAQNARELILQRAEMAYGNARLDLINNADAIANSQGLSLAGRADTPTMVRELGSATDSLSTAVTPAGRRAATDIIDSRIQDLQTLSANPQLASNLRASSEALNTSFANLADARYLYATNDALRSRIADFLWNNPTMLAAYRWQVILPTAYLVDNMGQWLYREHQRATGQANDASGHAQAAQQGTAVAGAAAAGVAAGAALRSGPQSTDPTADRVTGPVLPRQAEAQNLVYARTAQEAQDASRYYNEVNRTQHGGLTGVAFPYFYRGPGAPAPATEAQVVLPAPNRLAYSGAISPQQERPINTAFDWRRTQMGLSQIGGRNDSFMPGQLLSVEARRQIRASGSSREDQSAQNLMARHFAFLVGATESGGGAAGTTVVQMPGSEDTEAHNPDLPNSAVARTSGQTGSNDPNLTVVTTGGAQTVAVRNDDEENPPITLTTV